MSLIDGSILSSMPLAQTARGGDFWFPIQGSEVAAGHDFVFYFIMITCLIFFAAILGVTGYFTVKYRKRPRHKEEQTATHNTRLEIAWSVGPLFLLLAMFAMSTYWYMGMVGAPVSDDTIAVRCVASQWDWKFNYVKDGDNYECENLHCVKGRPVEVTCTAKKVTHSLFVAAMRVKQDVVPGRYSRLFFTPTKVSPPPKKYDGAWGDDEESKYGIIENMPSADIGGWMIYCTEYCGDRHSLMRARLYVHETEEQMWSAIEAEGDLSKFKGAALGKKLYTKRGCVACHSNKSNSEEWLKSGPNWGNIFDVCDIAEGGTRNCKTRAELIEYIIESVRKPDAKHVISPKGRAGSGMMTYTASDVTDEQILAIVEYMLTLTDKHKEWRAGGGK